MDIYFFQGPYLNPKLIRYIKVGGLLTLLTTFVTPAISKKSCCIDTDSLEIFSDIEYVQYGSRKLLLDIYKPICYKSQKLATIVVIRGGGWKIGDKEGFSKIASHLAGFGFATVCIEFRTSKEALFPAAVLDVKSAIQWVIQNANVYDFNAEMIGILGGSAGAHLGMLAAFSNKNALLNPSGTPENRKVKAVVGMATPTDFSKLPDNTAISDWLGKKYHEDTALWYSASPCQYIDKESPAMLFIQSSADNIVPHDQAVASVGKMGAMNIYAELVMIPGAHHAFWNDEDWFTHAMKKIVTFFHEQLKE